jgi:IS5 family transposase
MKEFNPNQTTMITLEMLVTKNHQYRKILELLNFTSLCKPILKLNRDENTGGKQGYGITKLFKCIFIQFLEDLSDRQLEEKLQDSSSSKLFCGFNLTDKTPHFSLFTKVRERIGTSRLSKMFQKLRIQLKKRGYLLENFTFVDSTHIVRKQALWEERDKAIAKKYEKLNNKTLPKVSVDKESRIGCKGKNKYWYGYKSNISVDMQSGLINKISLTPANITDAKALRYICPNKGAVYGDKGYCTKDAAIEIKKRGCHNATIKKNNMKGKNKELDKWYSKLRSPYERVFSKLSKKTRYIGMVKNQLTMTMYGIIHNTKRLLKLAPELKLTYN